MQKVHDHPLTPLKDHQLPKNGYDWRMYEPDDYHEDYHQHGYSDYDYFMQ